MPSFFRRAGAELLRMIERVLDPAAETDRILFYAKDVSGVTQAFARASDGSIYQLTPPGFSAAGELTPASLGGGTTNDYNPAGIANATIVRQNLTAASTLSGLVAGSTGRRLTFININGTQANQLTFQQEGAGSAAANRFALPSGLDWVIPIGGSITFVYDGTSSRWRCVALSSNTFPIGTTSNPGLVVGTTPTRGWRDGGATLRYVNTGGTDVMNLGSDVTIAGQLSQSGGQVNFNTGSSGFINTGPIATSDIVLLTGDTTPPALTGGTVNDYSTAGMASNETIRQDLTAATTLTGLTTGADGKLFTFQNIATVLGRNITFTHEDAGSLAANRFNLPSQASFTLVVGAGCTFRYDSTSLRWRLIAS